MGLGFVLLASAAAWMLEGREDAPYLPGERTEGITAGLERNAPVGEAPVRYTNVASIAGVETRHFHGERSSQLPEDMGSGVAWGDYDGDGDPDLFVANAAGSLDRRAHWPESPTGYRLFRNDGDGTFSDVTTSAGVAAAELGMAAAWGDVDGDRDLDLVVTHWGGVHFWRNRGDGSFEEATEAAGLAHEGPWAGASWGDYDRDGDIDLYLCGYVRYEPRLGDGAVVTQYDAVIPASLNPSVHPPAPNLLLANDGTGRFTDVTEAAGVVNAEGRSLGAAWSDLDDDGWPDLYIANDISDNALYRNLGDGTFEDISHPAWVADYRGAMGLAVADWDRDGDQDLFVSHWVAQENALYVNLLRHRTRQSDELRFMDDADRVGLGQVALDHVGWGSFFLDFDRDGLQDLFVANGSTFQQEQDTKRLVPETPLLFWNRGPSEGFDEVGALASPYFEMLHVGRGAAPADYDLDGDVDFAVVHHGGSLALLRAEGRPPGHWLAIDLAGTASNSFGVGAKVTVETDEATQVQFVGATPSYLSQPELTLHFGLGAATSVKRVEVRWPSGRVQELTGVAGDRRISIEETP
jgi:hypothetical protein